MPRLPLALLVLATPGVPAVAEPALTPAIVVLQDLARRDLRTPTRFNLCGMFVRARARQPDGATHEWDLAVSVFRRNSRIVEGAVELPEASYRLGHELLHIGFARHVGAHEDRLSAEPLNAIECFARQILVEVADRHSRAVLGEGERDSASDASRSTRDEHRFSAKIQKIRCE